MTSSSQGNSIFASLIASDDEASEDRGADLEATNTNGFYSPIEQQIDQVLMV